MKSEVEHVVGSVDWDAEDMSKGYIKCPGHNLHTRPTKRTDTVIFVNGVATVFCYHMSCQAVIQEANQRLRRALRLKSGWKPSKMTEEDKVKADRKDRLEAEANLYAKHKDSIFEDFKWPVADIMSDSSPVSETDPFRQYLKLWDEEDVVWMGDVGDSGEVKHHKHFRPAKEWAKLEKTPYPFLCASTFSPEGFRRIQADVMSRKFTVIEADKLNPDPEVNMDMSGALFRWLREEKGWKLRCVISSGNKSLHGHFDYDQKQAAWAKVALEPLGADLAAMRPAQPVRSPGWVRENGREQQLLWI